MRTPALLRAAAGALLASLLAPAASALVVFPPEALLLEGGPAPGGGSFVSVGGPARSESYDAVLRASRGGSAATLGILLGEEDAVDAAATGSAVLQAFAHFDAGLALSPLPAGRIVASDPTRLHSHAGVGREAAVDVRLVADVGGGSATHGVSQLPETRVGIGLLAGSALLGMLHTSRRRRR